MFVRNKVPTGPALFAMLAQDNDVVASIWTHEAEPIIRMQFEAVTLRSLRTATLRFIFEELLVTPGL